MTPIIRAVSISALISCKDLGEKVNEWLIQWRKERSHEELDSFAFEGYQRESYLIPVQTARFGSGEAKCTIMESPILGVFSDGASKE